MNNNSLEQTFTNTANAIRAKLHTQDGIAPDNFASEIAKISGGSGDTGIYHVNTLAERDSLSAKDSDICLVHSIQETEISVNSVFNTFTFKDSFTIDTAIQDSVRASFRNNDGAMCELRIEYYDNRLSIQIFADIDGNFKDADIEYTSQDGLTFNLDMAQGNLIDGNIVNLPVKVSYEDEGRPIDQNIFKFGTIKELYFPGIYKYDGTSWNYLDIGITTPQDNIFANKKAYTSSGVIQGTFDRSRYKNTNIYYGTGAPDITPTSNGALYLQVKSANSQANIGKNNYSINFISKKDTNYNKVEEETLPYDMYDITHYKNKVYGFYKNTNTDRYIYEFNLDTKQFRQIYHFTYNDYSYSKIIVTDENTAFLFMYNRNIYKLDLTTLNTSELGMPEEYNKHSTSSALIHYKKENQLIRLTKSSDYKYYNIHRYDLTNSVWLSNIKVQDSGSLDAYSLLTNCNTVYDYIGDNKIIINYNSVRIVNLDDFSYTNTSALTGGNPAAYDGENNIIYSYFVNGYQGFYICKDTLSDGTYSNYSISVDLISYPIKGQFYSSYQIFYNNKVYMFTSYKSTGYLTTFSNIKGQINKRNISGLTVYLGETIDEKFNILEDEYYIDNLLIYDTSSTEGNNNYNAILKYYKYVDNNWVLVKDYTQQNNS